MTHPPSATALPRPRRATALLLTVALVAAALTAAALTVAPTARAASATDGGSAALPDLRVAALWASNSTPTEGDWVTITANVTNQGDAAAENFTIRFVLDGGQTLEEAQWDLLDAGDHAKLSIQWRAEAGDHTIVAEADADDRVGESDETNNRRAVDVRVAAETGVADLAVHSVATDPARPRVRDDVALTANVTNLGNATARDFHVRFRVEGQGNATEWLVHVDAVAPGEVRLVKAGPWRPDREGNHSLTVTADAADAVNESDESNNARGAQVAVAPALADLTITGVSYTPGAPEGGDEVTFAARIRNQGGSAAGAFDVWFMVDGAWHDTTARVSSLHVGDTIVVESAPWRATRGDHTITVVVDPRSEVNESRVNNNNVTRGFHVVRDHVERTLLDERANATLTASSGPKQVGPVGTPGVHVDESAEAGARVTARYDPNPTAPWCLAASNNGCVAPVPGFWPIDAWNATLTVEAWAAAGDAEARHREDVPLIGQVVAYLP